MSDLQELIHKTSMHAYEQGVKHETTRIIELLESEIKRLEAMAEGRGPAWRSAGIMNCKHTIALIKGEK